MNNTTTYSEICYIQGVDPSYLWQIDIPSLVLPLPKLILQMTLALIVNHGLFLVSEYAHQPRIIADIFTALVISPSTLKLIHHQLGEIVWPLQSQTILETVGNMGLLFTMFIQGLHVDITPTIRQETVKMLALSRSLVILPFVMGCILYSMFRISTDENRNVRNAEVATIYWATLIAATSLPTLAPILSKLKLLCTNIGRDALSIGTINGIYSWFFTILILTFSSVSPNNHHHILSLSTLYVALFQIIFFVFCIVLIRPVIAKLVGEVAEGENYSDATVQAILFLVLTCGFMADYFGSHFTYGVYVLGMVIPNRVLSSTLIDKMEDCVSGILMPLYFAAIGTKLNIITLFQEFKYIWVIAIGVFVKPLCMLAFSIILKMPILDGCAIGVILSAKGLLPLTILFIGFERGHLSEDSFAILLLILLLSTIMIQPIISFGYKRLRNINQPYDQRALEGANPTNEFRIITCIHSPQNIPSIINLLEITNVTTQTPVAVSALHLVEQQGQAFPMLIEHESRANLDISPSSGSVKRFFTRENFASDQIRNALEDYQEEHNATTPFITNLTLISSIDTFHEDICNLAENTQTTLIILSFHKRQGIDGKLEDINTEFGAVNQSVMDIAPCSVGLLVDQGLRLCALSSSTPMTTSQNGMDHQDIQIVMVFIGGPDDREALTYAWRMAGHPFVTLTVVRFVVGDHPIDVHSIYNKMGDGGGEGGDETDGKITILIENEREKQIDEEFIHAFNQSTSFDASICYVERVSNSGEETVNLLREMHHDYDLYVVGRSRSMLSPLTAGLVEWSECPELGVVGDVLITSDFSTNTSVLVIQQYSGGVKYDKNDKRCSDDE